MRDGLSDREAFRRTIGELKRRGQSDLLSTGVLIDLPLAKELARKGSDVRCGVNLVCCPNREIVGRIAAIQRRLFEYEPAQYYYPPQDLHLTLVEICHSRTEEEANEIALAAQSLAPRFLARQPPAVVDEPTLAYDSKSAALNFLPRDERLQRVREAVREDLACHGLPVASRYPPRSAHIALLRYTTPLRTAAEKWVEVLNSCEITLEGAWVLTPVWLTWGATWYGMENRISRYGPMIVGSEVSDAIA
jgi:2'-5' RNA ligase